MANDLAPHGVVLQLSFEVHPVLSNGYYAGVPSDSNSSPIVVEIKCQDRALAMAKVREVINTLRSFQNVGN